MSDVLMKCGHTAQGHTEDGQPCCVICAGIHPGAYAIEDKPPELKGRKAKCTMCSKEVESSYSLPFFERGSNDDRYYCGCRGWD